MKKLITIFLCLPMIALSQDTSLIKYEDKFDKSISYSTKAQNYADAKKTVMGWYFGATKNYYVFRIGAVENKSGSQCIEKNASITFLFVDNSKLELKHISEFSCSDPLYLYLLTPVIK